MSPEDLARIRAAFDAAVEHPESAWADVARSELADAPHLLGDALDLLDRETRLAKLRTQRAFDAALDDLTEQERQSWIGRRIGRFEIVAELGSGGMGRVFKARNLESPEQLVALKVVRPERFNRSLAERFSSERRILARLNHPGIAFFVDAGSHEGLAYISMELVDGIPLPEYARQQDLPLRGRLQLFMALLDAVAHAHRSFVIHRDIKSDNVLVRPDGCVKLLDFGIAKPLDTESLRTVTHERTFTPISAAPEQILGGAVTIATDVYALGVLLYELIAGRLPFEQSDRRPGELERLVLNVPPPAMRSRQDRRAGGVSESIPDDLERIVAKALRKEADSRYRSVEQLQADLGRFLANEPISVAGGGHTYRLRKFIARNRLAVSITALAIALISSALVVTIIQNQRIRAERDLSQTTLSVLEEAFRSADPSGLAGNRTTARDILDRSVDAIAPLEQKNPQAFVSLASTIAEAQLALGISEPATRLLDRALPIAEREAHPDRNRVLLQLARAEVEQTYVSVARNYLSRLDSAERDSGPALIVRGRIAMADKQWAEAEFLLKQALPKLPFGGSEWVFAQSKLAIAIAEGGALDRAEQRTEIAEHLYGRAFPDRQEVKAQLQLSRLEVMDTAGDHERLCEDGARVVNDIRTQIGIQTSVAGLAAARVGAACQRLGQNELAARYQRMALQGFEPTLGLEHPMTYRTHYNLALALARPKQRREDVVSEFRTAIAGAESDSASQRAVINLFRLQLSRELAKAGTDQSLRDALRAFSRPNDPVRVSDIPAGDHAEYGAWANYLFWSVDCANAHQPAPLNSSTACSASLQKASCQNLRDLLCGINDVAASTGPVSTR
ncbi:hypothetical protein C7S18_00995 [Ahniella affigens]|uniref:Protein kinase domain-containing protein n=1 Tax=Ahniella affigens TaxID=2021234 RepID=A0A2P1PM03_9GAMM|nr:serine/threonine-protein kinase [Ahniella affigens]AVP95859.1 hypothetical protein C7S18_00995 [Ahniella affigens]